jgi:CheY-like chemotaxis protein
MKTSPLKILVALQNGEEASALQQDLECLGHHVQPCRDFGNALRWLRAWQPDLVVTEEGLGREAPDAGLRLAEYCRATEDHVNGWAGARTLMFIPIPDWERFKRAQQTGAHVIVTGADFEAAIRYIQTIADNLVTDRRLGPALSGIHRFKGDGPRSKCEDCEWIGATISYGSSQADVRNLTPVRIALLNALLFRRRGQSPAAIVEICRDSLFIKRILRDHVVRESAIKMEITRLRRHLDEALEAMGAHCTGKNFLPLVPHGAKTYCLSGNRRLIHIRGEESSRMGPW